MISSQSLLHQATQLHAAGRLGEAETLYRRLLAADPDQPDALHQLGVLATETGHAAQGEPLVRRAIARQPGAFMYHSSLGTILRALGRAQEAERSVRLALQLRPDMAELHHQLAQALQDQGRSLDAEAALRRALALKPDFDAAHLDLANVLVASGRGVEAEALLRPAIARATQRMQLPDPRTLNTLGIALAAQHRHADALAAFDRALSLDPGYQSALINRAHALAALQRWEAAEQAFQSALVHAPTDPELQLGLAKTRMELGRTSEIEALARSVLRERPDDAHARYVLAVALMMQDRIDDALPMFEALIAADPNDARAWRAIGAMRREQGLWQESLVAFERAVRLAPDNPEINTGYGYALLTNGEFDRGWQHFQKRPDPVKQLGGAAPRWDGTPTRETVLVKAEQGLGDAIQFVRFLPIAATRARVVLECAPALRALFSAALFSGADGPVDIVADGVMPRHDRYCLLMDLPAILAIPPTEFSASVPYLHADPARVAVWRDRFARLEGRRVGLVWAGNPRFNVDRHRSVPFAALGPLLAVPGVSFVSLQVGAARAAMTPGAAFDAAPWLDDFADTAAAIMALDLVISVDTSVAHLAGALGAPTWLLNRASTDWRWMLERTDSIWYPTLRQFRQPALGDWGSVIAEVVAALGREAFAGAALADRDRG